MPQQIQAPDGSLVEFPDGMSDGEMARAMAREYGAPKRKSQSLGFIQGVNRVGKNLAPALDVLPFTNTSSIIRRQNQPMVDEYIANREKTQEGGAAGKFAGNLLASAPLAAFGGPATAGALQGYATSDADDIGGKLADTALGAVGGKIGSKIVEKGADLIAPLISPAVRKLADSGVKLTPGQVKGGKAMVREDKLMSRPVVGDAIAAGRRESIETFNRATVDEAMKPLGVKLPKDTATGHDAIAFAQKSVDDAYNAVVPKLRVQPDKRFVAGTVKVYDDVKTLPEPQQKQFQAVLDQIKFGQNGQLSGRALKNAQSELSRLARSYGGSASAGERELGRAIGGLKGELDDLMMRQNPQFAPDLKKANEAFRGLIVLEGAAKNADKGVFSTGQLKAAVRQADSSRRKGKTASGKAFMQDMSEAGRKVLPSKTPDSGTAGRVLSGNILSNVAGGGALVNYRMAQMGAKAALAQRPAVARKVGNLLRRLQAPGGLLAATGLVEVTK